MKSTLAPLLAVLLPLGLHAQTAPPARFGGITLQTHDFNTGQPHSFTSDGNTATIVAGGADIWQAADSFVFNYLAVTNDFDFRLRVLSVEDADGGGFARSGLMVRDALTAGNRHMMVPVNANNTSQTIYRTRAGDNALDNGTVIPAFGSNSWVRLVRHGNVFADFMSANGTNWTPIYQFDGAQEGDGAFTNAVMYLGIATSSHHPGKTTTVVVSDFGITPFAARLGPPSATAEPADAAPQSFVEVVTGPRVALTPPMGWNSYDAWGTSITEAETLANAAAMKNLLRAHGWQYVVIDARWYDSVSSFDDRDFNKERDGAKLFADEFGRMLPATNRFPSAIGGNGFKPLADKIHALDLKFGFHMMRGIPRQAVFARTPIEGSTFTAADAANTNSICGWCPDMFGVRDNEAGQAWYDSMFRLYAAWGLDFIKVDDLSVPYSAGEIEMIHKAIDKCGRPIVFSTSPGPADVAHAAHIAANANMWRISGDFWDRWKDLDHAFDLVAAWQGKGGPGHWPDADMIPFGHLGIKCTIAGKERQTHFTRDEQRTLMSLWSLAPSPLMLGANLTDLDAWTLSLLTNDEVIAVNQDALGKPAQRVLRKAGGEIWVKELQGGSKAVGLFNRTDKALTLEVLWSEVIGLSSLQQARDLWAHKDLGGSKSFSVELPPHGSLLLSVVSTTTLPPLPPMPEISQPLPPDSVPLGALANSPEVKLDLPIAPGPFAPTWGSIEKNYPGTPDWLRQAKFGIWVHFGPQASGQSGDWYARNLYKPGMPAYKNHLKNFGHPSEVGYKEVLRDWNPTKLNPAALTEIYKDAGARFLMIQGVHHDNYDLWNSHYQPWNSVNLGPKRDLLGEWAKACHAEGMRFGVTFHHEYSWWWWQTAFGSDKQGAKAGVPYDGHLTLADGKGKWWEGLDPRRLYGIDLREYKGVTEAANSGWAPPPPGIFSRHLDYDKWYATQWALRMMDVVDQYNPDFIYTDGTDQQPFSGSGTGSGLKADAMQTVIADFYNTTLARRGQVDTFSIVKFRKKTNGTVTTEEFGLPDHVRTDQAWIGETPVGDWFYEPGFTYDSGMMIRYITEAAARDGNAAICISLRPDGSLEDGCRKMLKEVGVWMRTNGEGIYGSHAWKIPGEGELVNGKLKQLPGGKLGRHHADFKFGPQDFRFTVGSNGCLYAYCLTVPAPGSQLKITSLGTDAKLLAQPIQSVSLLGGTNPLVWKQEPDGLVIICPKQMPFHTAVGFKIGRPESVGGPQANQRGEIRAAAK